MYVFVCACVCVYVCVRVYVRVPMRMQRVFALVCSYKLQGTKLEKVKKIQPTVPCALLVASSDLVILPSSSFLRRTCCIEDLPSSSARHRHCTAFWDLQRTRIRSV